MKLGIALLILVSLRHNGALWIQDLTGFPQKGAFYVMGGAWEAVLCVVLATYLWKQKEHLGVFACVIGASEGFQMALCRLLQGPNPKNLCDAYFGIPIGATIVSVYTLWLCNYVGRNKMNNRALIAVPIISAAEVSYLTTPYAGIGLLALCYAVWRRHGQRT